MVRWLIGLVLVCALAGCGGGGGGGSTPSPASIPGISSLSGNKTSALLNEGSGAVTVSFTCNFVDAGGDIATMTIESYDVTTGVQSMSKSIPITGVSGMTSGTIGGSVVVSTTARGSWNVHIFVTDAAGNKSNVLTTTWAII